MSRLILSKKSLAQLMVLFLTILFVMACNVRGVVPFESPYPPGVNTYEMGYPGKESSPSEIDLATLSCPSDSLKPNLNLGSISGLIYQKSQRAIISNTSIYLTFAQGDEKDIPPPILAGPIREKGDIVSKTDSRGCFYFNNIPPGNYYLVVAFGYDYDIVVKSLEDPTPLLIRVEPNKRLALGVLIVP